jgi:starch phosphorylase
MYTLEQDIRRVSDAPLWQFRTAASQSLDEYARDNLTVSGASPESVDEANTLTRGFARRFATYKRPYLLPHDPRRLRRLLSNPQRPVLLILAGKAHSADQAGGRVCAGGWAGI